MKQKAQAKRILLPTDMVLKLFLILFLVLQTSWNSHQRN